ncbi:MAG: hypothetical protein HY559_04775 [Gammaproteobacteria bacterium]|nr:hypothetical protein [Gammaproteobacteria bacterium]
MKKISLMLSCCLVTGCASVLTGTEDTITINSQEKDATILVDHQPIGKEAVSWQVKRGEPHTIMARKEGCKDVIIQTDRKFNLVSLLGIPIDLGLITISVDLLTGAAWKTSPRAYSVTPDCSRV